MAFKMIWYTKGAHLKFPSQPHQPLFEGVGENPNYVKTNLFTLNLMCQVTFGDSFKSFSNGGGGGIVMGHPMYSS